MKTVWFHRPVFHPRTPPPTQPSTLEPPRCCLYFRLRWRGNLAFLAWTTFFTSSKALLTGRSLGYLLLIKPGFITAVLSRSPFLVKVPTFVLSSWQVLRGRWYPPISLPFLLAVSCFWLNPMYLHYDTALFCV